jgi:two-component system, NtrC family, sensor kinase
MGQNGPEFANAYLTTLQEHLARAGEAPLMQAFDLGRTAFSRGLGVVDIAVVHHESLAAILGRLPTLEEHVQATRKASEIQAESLSVYEMALLGYRDANADLTRLNQELNQQAEELAKLAATELEARLELEQTHRELKRAQSQLVNSAKLASLGQLVAGVAHEVNNPLSFVANNLAVLQRDTHHLPDLLELYTEAAELAAEHQPELQRRMRDMAEQIDLPYLRENLEGILARSRQGLRRIQQIVLDLRNFAHLDQGTLPDFTDLNANIISTVNLIRGSAELNHVVLDLDLAPLPPVWCDALKINQVILNLSSNAIESCVGEGAGTVTVRTRSAGNHVVIEVVDSGRGIAPAIRDKIFDPFFTTKPPGKGTGLGLSISHAIVEEHNGEIEVESTPGQGTCFTVRLPFQRPR